MEYQSTEIGELAKALAAAQGEMDAAKKDGQGNYGKYTTISSILEVVKEALSKNGLAVVQAPMPCESGNICLRTTLMHSSGQWIASQLTMKADNSSPQKIGSVMTYARRYALAAILGVGQEDDDAQSAQDEYERQARKAQKQRHEDDRAQAKASNPNPPSKEQLAAFWACMKQRHPDAQTKEEYAAMAYADIGQFVGREIKTASALTASEISDFLNACNSSDNYF